MMLTQLDRLVSKQLKEKGYNLVPPDEVEAAIAGAHIDFTQPAERNEPSLLSIGDQTHADLVALVVIRKVGAEFIPPDDDTNAKQPIKFEPWAEMKFWLSDTKSRKAMFENKDLEGHCVWKLQPKNDWLERIAAPVAVGVEDELPLSQPGS